MNKKPSSSGPGGLDVEGVTEILADAMDLDATAREAFLDRACGADHALRAEVESLLAKQDSTRWDGFLNRPAAEHVAEQIVRDEEVPERFGPYRILETLGEGGMGTVYLAEQREPVTRRVALKVIRILNQARLRQRFAAECQALARLNHPNIATLFEVGTTDEGFPFVAMEWIDGQVITEWCDETAVGIEQRLRLFLTVCEGIRHAHEKGVLHCDLKPDNVLVTQVGGTASAKIIDFGIARALDEPLLAEGEMTRKQILGTPQYMSPEAITQSGRGHLDTRADVYSLGLMLYELLVGTLPFDFEGKPVFVMMRERKETRELSPSQRLAQLDEDHQESIVHQRRTSLRQLGRRVKGDLDAIVMKAIARDPVHRYGTPAELAADIERHLARRPVEARPASAGYHFGRFVRRHAGAVLAAMLILGTLLWGLATRTLEAQRANAEAERAMQALDESEQVRQFMIDLFQGANPERTAGATLTVRELLERGAESLREALPEQPLVRARFLQTVGSIFVELGEFERAAELLEEALDLRRRRLDTSDPELIDSEEALGLAYRRMQQFDRAEPLLINVLEARRADPEVEPELLAQAHSHLGNLYWRQERFDEAEAAHRQALSLRAAIAPHEERGRARANEAESANNLGVLLQAVRRNAEARPHLLRAVELFRQELGESHPRVASALNNLGLAEKYLDTWPQAARRFQEATEILEAAYGPDHFRSLFGRRNLVYELLRQHRFAQAIDEAGRVVETAEGLGDAGSLAQALLLLGDAERRAGSYEDALQSYRRAVAVATSALGPRHRQAVASRARLALGLAHLGQPDRAVELLEDIAQVQDRTLDALHPSRLATENRLGYVYRVSDRFGEAERHHRKELEGQTERLGDRHERVATAAHVLGICLAGQGRATEAATLFEQALDIRREQYGDSHPTVGDSAHELALVERERGRLQRAREMLELAVAVRRAAYPPDDADLAATLEALAELGGD